MAESKEVKQKSISSNNNLGLPSLNSQQNQIKIMPHILRDNRELEAVAYDYNLLSRKLEKDINFLNSIDSYGFSLLHLASFGTKANIKCVILLLEHNVDTSFKCNHKRTALHYACSHGHLEIAKILIKANPKMLEEKDKDLETPLDIAKRKNHQKIVDYISTYREQPKKDGEVAVENNMLDELKVLVMQYLIAAKSNQVDIHALKASEQSIINHPLYLHYLGYLDKELLEQLLVYSCK